MVKLVLRFILIGQAEVRVRFATRIQIDGNRSLRIWGASDGAPECFDLEQIEAISIERAIDTRIAA